MKQETQRAQVLSIAQADHAILASVIDNFRRLFMGVHTADADKRFAEIRQLITEKTFEHFDYEDKQVFPALLAGNPDKKVEQLVAELSQEHKTLLKETQRVNALLHQRNLNNCTGEVWSVMMELLTAFEKHAAKEDQLFALFN